jgi:uncharacterized protein (DUF2252 family)
MLYVVIRDEAKHPEYRLLDIKEATAAAAPSAKGAKMPRGYADRVVAGARALSLSRGQNDGSYCL